MRMGFIVGLGGEQKYKIVKVNYVVTSSFLPPKEKIGLKDRLARVVTSDFTDWTDAPTTDNMNTEYMCSTVGKED
jgi:hypothetical protein